jgi:hypothetical protein
LNILTYFLFWYFLFLLYVHKKSMVFLKRYVSYKDHTLKIPVWLFTQIAGEKLTLCVFCVEVLKINELNIHVDLMFGRNSHSPYWWSEYSNKVQRKSKEIPMVTSRKLCELAHPKFIWISHVISGIGKYNITHKMSICIIWRINILALVTYKLVTWKVK